MLLASRITLRIVCDYHEILMRFAPPDADYPQSPYILGTTKDISARADTEGEDRVAYMAYMTLMDETVSPLEYF